MKNIIYYNYLKANSENELKIKIQSTMLKRCNYTHIG